MGNVLYFVNGSQESLTFDPLSDSPEAEQDKQAGMYWIKDVIVEDALFDRRKVPIPGKDTVDIRKFGFRSRPMSASVLIQDVSYSAVKEQVLNLREILENKLFSVTTPYGDTYETCQLLSPGGAADGPIYPTINGMYAMIMTIRWEHLGD